MIRSTGIQLLQNATRLGHTELTYQGRESKQATPRIIPNKQTRVSPTHFHPHKKKKLGEIIITLEA